MHRHFTAALVVALGLAGAAQAAPAAQILKMKAPNGGPELGTAKVTQGPRGVLLRLELSGLTPGWHGIHFHEKGDCLSSDFTSAGGHVHGAAPVQHGLLNPAANESGDLPNIFVGADGKVTVELYSTAVALTHDQNRPYLWDADGSALVIHANPDDYTTQPIGGAGPRVACGVIEGPV